MELLELLGRRILLWFGTAGFRREALGDGGGAFLSPVGEVRRVEALAAEKSADGAWGGGGVCGGEYLLLIGSREAAAVGAGPDLRGGWLWVGGVGGRGTALLAQVTISSSTSDPSAIRLPPAEFFYRIRSKAITLIRPRRLLSTPADSCTGSDGRMRTNPSVRISPGANFRRTIASI